MTPGRDRPQAVRVRMFPLVNGEVVFPRFHGVIPLKLLWHEIRRMLSALMCYLYVLSPFRSR